MDNLGEKVNLRDNEKLLVDSEFSKRKKETWVAYLLWFFTGGIGGHRYYLGDFALGVGMTCLNWMTFGIWGLVDVFFINRRLQEKNDEIESEIIRNVKWHRP